MNIPEKLLRDFGKDAEEVFISAVLFDMKVIEVMGECGRRNFPEISPAEIKILYAEIIADRIGRW